MAEESHILAFILVRHLDLPTPWLELHLHMRVRACVRGVRVSMRASLSLPAASNCSSVNVMSRPSTEFSNTYLCTRVRNHAGGWAAGWQVYTHGCVRANVCA